MSTTKASSSLTIKEKEIVRVFVKKAEKQGRGKYNDYTPEERAAIVNVMSPYKAFNRC